MLELTCCRNLDSGGSSSPPQRCVVWKVEILLGRKPLKDVQVAKDIGNHGSTLHMVEERRKASLTKERQKHNNIIVRH